MKNIYPVLVVMLVFVGLCGCRRTQELSQPQSTQKPAIKQEIKAGRLLAPAFENAVNGLCPDGELQKYVGAVGARVVGAIPGWHPREFDFSFTAVNSREANAYALPGGKIYVTRGLLEKLATEDELAAVIAHEVAHTTLRHCGTGRMPRLKEALALRTFKFTAKQETDATEWGVFYLFRTGYYNPYATVAAMRTLDAQPVWQEAHPPDNRSAEDIEHLIKNRYPDLSKRQGGRKQLPACIVHLQKKAPFYYAIFEDGDRLQESAAAHLKEGRRKRAESELRLSLVYYNNAVVEAEKSRDLPAFFPARRGLARARLAEIAGREKYLKAARADFDKAKQIDANCYLARLYRGRYFLEVDKFYGPAEEEFKTAMRLNPGGEDSALPYYFMAKLFDNPDNPGRNAQKAADFYKKYLEHEPEGPHAREARERLELSK